MAQHLTVARPYAKAVFQTALASEHTEQWRDALAVLADASSTEELRGFAGDPQVDRGVLAQCVMALMSSVIADQVEQLGNDLRHFVQLLIDNGRLLVAGDIEIVFQRLLSEHNKTKIVDVYSAFELTSAQRDALTQSLEKRFSSHVSVSFHNQPDLIAGVLIRSGNWVLDGSMRARLARLSASLTHS